MPNLVLAKPLRPRNAAWQSSFVVNLCSTALGHALVARAKARIVIGRCRVAMTTLVHSFIWPLQQHCVELLHQLLLDLALLGLEAREA
jgi:hypothetical protein